MTARKKVRRTTARLNPRVSGASAVAAAVGVLVLVPTIAGCGVIDSVQRSMADAWSVTYTITTDSSSPVTLTDVSYRTQEKRTVDPTTTEKDRVETTSAKDGTNRWSVETLAMTEAQVIVSATPPPGVAATCKILLDGAQEIASSTGKAGEPVTCEASTPKFKD